MRGFSRKQNNFFIFAQVAAQELLKTKNIEGERHTGPNIKVDVVGERSESFSSHFFGQPNFRNM